MRVAYNILLSLTITHSYYRKKDPAAPGGYEEAFDDFELVADNRTASLIKEYRMVAKKINNSWHLFFQAEGPFAEVAGSFAGKEFVFELIIKDSAFYTITSDDYLHGNEEMFWFSAPIETTLIPEKRKVYAPLQFDYTIHKQLRPVTVKLSTAKGRLIKSETITDTGKLAMNIDLTKEGQNIYDINEEGQPPVMHEKIFAGEVMHTDSFYGMICFKVLPPGDDGKGNEFNLHIEDNN